MKYITKTYEKTSKNEKGEGKASNFLQRWYSEGLWEGSAQVLGASTASQVPSGSPSSGCIPYPAQPPPRHLTQGAAAQQTLRESQWLPTDIQELVLSLVRIKVWPGSLESPPLGSVFLALYISAGNHKDTNGGILSKSLYGSPRLACTSTIPNLHPTPTPGKKKSIKSRK